MTCTKCGAWLSGQDALVCPSCNAPVNTVAIQAPCPAAAVLLPAQNPTPGKNFMLVTGIIIIVYNGLALAASLVGLLLAPLMAQMGTHYSTLTSDLLSLAWILFCLFLGIMAVTNHQKPEKARMVKTLATVAMFAAVIMPLVSVVWVLGSGFIDYVITDAMQDIHLYMSPAELAFMEQFMYIFMGAVMVIVIGILIAIEMVLAVLVRVGARKNEKAYEMAQQAPPQV